MFHEWRENTVSCSFPDCMEVITVDCEVKRQGLYTIKLFAGHKPFFRDICIADLRDDVTQRRTFIA